MSHVPEVPERKNIQVVEKSTYRDLAAKNPNFTESVYRMVLTPLMHANNRIQPTY